jgi:hypothetical protein
VVRGQAFLLFIDLKRRKMSAPVVLKEARARRIAFLLFGDQEADVVRLIQTLRVCSDRNAETAALVPDQVVVRIAIWGSLIANAHGILFIAIWV